VAVGLMLLFRVHHMIQAWLITVLPYWLQDFSVAF
jgi:cytochrome c-type biogenesis protein